MQIIVATDIFGYTKYLESLAATLCSDNIHINIIDPYKTEQRFFTDQTHAYHSFVQEGGHDHYAKCVHAALTGTQEAVTLIGFSAGASAAWKIASTYTNIHLVQQFIGFYPTQIQHYQPNTTLFPTTLIFPNIETSFDINQVILKLSKHRNIQCIHTEYEHGFMNQLSSGYSTIGYEVFCKCVITKGNCRTNYRATLS